MVYVQNGRKINVRTTSNRIELTVRSLLSCSHSAVHVCSGGLQDMMEQDLGLQVAVDLCFAGS